MFLRIYEGYGQIEGWIWLWACESIIPLGGHSSSSNAAWGVFDRSKSQLEHLWLIALATVVRRQGKDH